MIENLKHGKGIADVLRVFKYFFKNCYKRSITKPRALLKDPIAFFSAEWLCNTFDMDVVILIRHPAAFVSSLKRLNWRHPFEHFLAQDQLMADFLEPFRSKIKVCAENKCDIISQGILLWYIFHHVVRIYQDMRPQWIFVKHEDLSRDPVSEFKKIYDQLGLRFSAKIGSVINDLSSSSNPSEVSDKSFDEISRDSRKNIWNWRRRLTKEEIGRIKNGVDPLASAFYDESDWRVD